MAIVVAGISVVQPYILARSAIAVSCPADTTEDILANIAVPAGAMGANGILRVTTNWTFTNNGNPKTLRVRFSGTSGTGFLSFNAASLAAQRIVQEISNRGSTNAQYGQAVGSGTANILNTGVTAAVDTTLAASIVISGQKGTLGDALTLESYLVELLPSA